MGYYWVILARTEERRRCRGRKETVAARNMACFAAPAGIVTGAAPAGNANVAIVIHLNKKRHLRIRAKKGFTIDISSNPWRIS